MLHGPFRCKNRSSLHVQPARQAKSGPPKDTAWDEPESGLSVIVLHFPGQCKSLVGWRRGGQAKLRRRGPEDQAIGASDRAP